MQQHQRARHTTHYTLQIWNSGALSEFFFAVIWKSVYFVCSTYTFFHTYVTYINPYTTNQLMCKVLPLMQLLSSNENKMGKFVTLWLKRHTHTHTSITDRSPTHPPPPPSPMQIYILHINVKQSFESIFLFLLFSLSFIISVFSWVMMCGNLYETWHQFKHKNYPNKK